MDENGINGEALSHTQRMEQKIQQITNPTKDSVATKTDKTIVISSQDAEDYKAFKRQKQIAEIMSAMSRTETSLLKTDSVQRACERAVRLK